MACGQARRCFWVRREARPFPTTPTLPIDTATSPDVLHWSRYRTGMHDRARRPRRDLHHKSCGARRLKLPPLAGAEALDICRCSLGQTGARAVIGIDVHAAILAGSLGVALNLGVAAIAVYLRRRH